MKIKKENIAFALIFISLLFLSGHSLSIVAGTTTKFLLLFIGFLGCALINPKIRTRGNNSWFVLLTTFGALLSFCFNISTNPIIDTGLFLLRIILAYYIIQVIEFDFFAELYSSILTLLTAVSILIWGINTIGLEIPSYAYRSLNGFDYHTIFICTWQPQQNTIMGPFWESGLYTSFALYALILETFSTNRKIKYHRLFILAIGIYLSKSAAGYMLFIMSIYVMWAIRHKHSVLIDVMVIILSIVGFIYSDAIFQFLAVSNESVFWKLIGSNVTSNTRLYSPVACLQIFKDYFITGAGLNHATDIYNGYKTIYHMDALTSTSTFYLAAFGISGIGYTILMISGIIRQKQWSVVTKVLVGVLLFIIVNKEPHYSMCLTYVFFFYLNTTLDKEKEIADYQSLDGGKTI